jgi:hypothetical protein
LGVSSLDVGRWHPPAAFFRDFLSAYPETGGLDLPPRRPKIAPTPTVNKPIAVLNALSIKVGAGSGDMMAIVVARRPQNSVNASTVNKMIRNRSFIALTQASSAPSERDRPKETTPSRLKAEKKWSPSLDETRFLPAP